MAKLSAGDVVITINGQERVLKPTLRALTVISSQYNGLFKAREMIVQQDFAACVFIIRHGLNLNDREAKTLPDEIYENGLTFDLLGPLIRFMGILANGGKPLPDDPVDELQSTEGNA
jgi:hypothetical protein